MINIQKNILLASYTTFKIGGPAKYFSETKSIDEAKELCNWARQEKIPILILGGGSNVLISDQGFDGLVIKINNSDLKFEGKKIIADAGVNLSKVVLESVSNNLSGLEWAIGIPGTIGGAVFGNSGAYGHSISESVSKIKTISIDDCTTLKEYSHKDCGFVYRGSNFSAKGGSASGGKNTNKEIIVNVEMELADGKKEDNKKMIKDIMSQRKMKIPPFPSAGSFFKNYKLEKNAQEDSLIKKFPELLQKARSGKIATGYLLEQCKLKGTQIGGAMIAKEHANFIVNTGKATAKDVLALVDLCKKKVKEKYGFELEIEKRLLGFD